MVNFFVGLDLGQASDYTALSVLERITDVNDESIYHLRSLERVRGESYVNIVAKVATMMSQPPLVNDGTLIVDQTGVGAAVVDMFKKAKLRSVAISIHGGDHVSRDGLLWRVPKRDLVGVSQILVQNDRLRWGLRLKLAMALRGEILNFKCKINPATAHDSYSAWREDEHDDLVLSVALAAWFAECVARINIKIPQPVNAIHGRPYYPAYGMETPNKFDILRHEGFDQRMQYAAEKAAADVANNQKK